SLSLVCPGVLDMRPLTGLATRTVVISGDRGPAAERVRTALQSVEGINTVTLRHYEALMWSDLAVDRRADITPAMLCFLQSIDRRGWPEALRLPEIEGEVADISYRIRGAGPPLVLMPLELALSQWTPLVAALAERYCTIELSGAFLGVVAALEGRGRSVY